LEKPMTKCRANFLGVDRRRQRQHLLETHHFGVSVTLDPANMDASAHDVHSDVLWRDAGNRDADAIAVIIRPHDLAHLLSFRVSSPMTDASPRMRVPGSSLR